MQLATKPMAVNKNRPFHRVNAPFLISGMGRELLLYGLKFMNHKKFTMCFSGVLALGLISTCAADVKLPPAAKKQGVTFANDIQPLLKGCVQCHGPEKQKAKIRLDSLADATKPKVLKAGDSANSQIVKSLARVCADDGENMPPKGKGEPFTAEQVGLVRAWIDQGAK